MNLKIPVILLGIYEVSRMGLVYAMAQAPTDIPGGVWDIAKEFPGLVIAGGVAYYVMKWLEKMLASLMKWLEKMLESQRVMLKEAHDSNQNFLLKLLSQIETQQNKMSDRIEQLTRQSAMVNATVSEFAKMDDVVERLMDRLDRRGEGRGERGL